MGTRSIAVSRAGRRHRTRDGQRSNERLVLLFGSAAVLSDPLCELGVPSAASSGFAEPRDFNDLPRAVIGPVDCIERLGTIYRKFGIPVVLFSATDDYVERFAALRKDADAVIGPKPTAEDLWWLRHTALSDSTRKGTVLVVEDDEASRLIYTRWLENAGYMVNAAGDAIDAFAVACRAPPDVIVTDVHLPACSGSEFAAVLRKEPRLNLVPVIYVSTDAAAAHQATALSYAGELFLPKPVSAEQLICHVNALWRRRRMEDAWAGRDGLTGVLNRAAFYGSLRTALGRADRSGRPLAMALLDLDHFKHVNDRYGHMVGDAVLRRVADLLLSRLRSTDTVGRIGGEEFAVILPDTPIAAAERVIDQLREAATADRAVPGPNGHSIRFSFSAGVAAWNRVEQPTALIERADRALYMAKRKGRGRVEITL